MTIKELKELLNEFDDDLEIKFDVDSVYGVYSESLPIERIQYVEDGFTEIHIPSLEQQKESESAYALLKC